MHTTRDDSLLGTMRFVSRHEDTQVYCANLPKAMMNQAMLDSVAYKTYYAIASGAEPPKLKKSQKKYDSAIASELSPSKKNSASKPQPSKKKAPVKATRGKGLNVLSEVALSEASHLKEATKRSKKDFHISQASGSGTDEGTKEDDDEEEDTDDVGDDDGNDDDDDDDETGEEKMDEEEDNDVTKELYKDVNVNLRDKDADMTEAEQGGADQHNVSYRSGFEQEEKDAHVTLTTVHDKTEGPMQSSFISSDFTSKLLNLKNPSPDFNEIASLINTATIHPPPPSINHLQQQATPTPTPTTSEVTTSFPTLPDFSFVFKFNDKVTNLEKDVSEMKQVYQYAQALSFIPAIIDRYLGNKLVETIQKAIHTQTAECKKEALADKKEYIDLIDTSVRTIIIEEVKAQLPHILPKAVSDFVTPVIERNITELLEAVVLAKSSSQPKSTYEAAASLSEFEFTKILMDKMEENKLYLRADYKRELYDALVKLYNTDKDLFDTYDRGTKRRKSSKEAESSKDPRSKEGKSSSSSKGTSRSHHKSSSKSAHAEEPSHTVNDSEVRQNQEFDTGNNDEQPNDKAALKRDCDTARAEKPPISFDELMDTSFDFSAFVLNWLNIPHLTQELLCSKATNERLDWHNPEGKPCSFDLCKPLPLILDHRGRQVIPRDYFINNNLEYLKGGSLSRKYSTLVTKTKAATYEIKWIEDMVPNLWSPIMVVYDKHAYWVTRLTIMKCYQKKLNLTKPDTFRPDLKKRIAYTAYSDPQGVIYVDQNNRNKLMRTDELHKFNDGTLDFVWTAHHDIASGIRIKYMPKKNWSRLDKQRARVMIQNIDKQLFERR
ncbi:hypothetical protein Tco_0286498 [Tanacetum coccineum]